MPVRNLPHHEAATDARDVRQFRKLAAVDPVVAVVANNRAVGRDGNHLEPVDLGELLGLGLRELSMAAQNIPRVKQRIRALDMVAATRRARAIMDQADPERIAALLDDFNAAAEPG